MLCVVYCVFEPTLPYTNNSLRGDHISYGMRKPSVDTQTKNVQKNGKAPQIFLEHTSKDWSLISKKLLHLMHQVPTRRSGSCMERGGVRKTKMLGPNVLAFRLITGGANYYAVGCYIPPSDLAML